MTGHLLDGRYRLAEQLADEVEATVYRAVDERLGRPVRLRLLAAELPADRLQAYADRVGRVASLNHPRVPPVLDFNLAAEAPYLVESELEASRLTDLLAAGEPFPADLLPRVATQAAELLGAAHGRGLIHGHLTPDSLAVSPEGEVYLIDLATPPPATLTLTDEACRAPELALGAEPDARTDVYALAAVLYHAASGRPAFTGDNPLALNTAKMAGCPELPARVPRTLAEVLRQCLSPNRSERPTDAVALALRLTDATTTPDLTATTVLEPTRVLPATPRPTFEPPRPAPEPVAEPGSGAFPVVGALLAALVVGLLWWALKNPGRELPAETGPATPSVVGLPEQEALTTLRDAGLQVTVAERRPSDTVRGGSVAEQQPAPGEPLPADRTIRLIISTGPQFVTVPDVRRLPVDEARALLPKYGLNVATQAVVDETRPDGVVIAQQPAAGLKVDKGSGVTLYVNKLPAAPTGTQPAETDTPPAETTGGSLVDTVVEQAGEAAKAKVDEVATELKEQGRQKVEELKERGREAVRQKKEELKETIVDAVKGKPDQPAEGGGQ